jgi:hypothetical protein
MKFSQLFLAIFVVGVQSLAPAVGKSKRLNHYIIDGNNLLHSKGVPRQVEKVTEQLKPIANTEPVLLVFDGRPGLERTETEEGNFRKVQLEEGASSDDFILSEISALGEESKDIRVKLITADKRLRVVALSKRPTVKQVVNPVIFWKKYRTRMAGLKKGPNTGNFDNNDL